MKKFLMLTLVVLAAVLAVAPAYAGDKPIQVALFSPIQIFAPSESIGGLRLTILYSDNNNMTGLDWGLVTETRGNLTGVQWTFVSMIEGSGTGIQWNFVGMTEGDFSGLKYAAIYNSTGGNMQGLQVGLINTAGSMKGIQLGLINIIHKGGWLPVFPIINGGF